MSSLPVTAHETPQPVSVRSGDATVVRAVAAFLVLLALAALLVVPGPGGVVAAVTVLVGAIALFAAASWRRRA